jgi:homoserine kinase
MNSPITAFAPATVANVGCGFDIFGLAINEPGDKVVAQISEAPGVRIQKITGDNGKLPTESEKNTASFSVMKMLESLQKTDIGIDLIIHKDMPLGSGLGSSAASSAAALVAVNELLGKPLTKHELLPFAMESEALACGSPHADNVAPSLLGGFVLIRSYDPLDVIQIQTPQELVVVVVHPDIEIMTADSRKVMKKKVSLSDAVMQSGNAAALIAGLLKDDYELVGRSLRDVMAEPARSMLIPGYDSARQSAMEAGALGFSISGSGPSVFALCRGEESGEKIKIAIMDAFKKNVGFDSEGYVSTINQEGAHVIN